MELVDLHCHLMPYVDDGATDLQEALELLTMQAEQGVGMVCLTPHLREDMFETPDEKVISGYNRLLTLVQEQRIPIKILFGREYFFDTQFENRLLSREIIPLGQSDVVLTEFGSRVTLETLLRAGQMIQENGYQPLFAHVERYRAIQENPDAALQLMERGIRLQVNAGSILGQEGRVQKKTAKYLLKKKWVFAVASDAHRVENRSPNLAKCAKYLKLRYGRAYTEELLQINPLSILYLQRS